MKLGFLTACLPKRPLADIAAWASGHGYEALEVAAWPALGDRPSPPPTSTPTLRPGPGAACSPSTA